MATERRAEEAERLLNTAMRARNAQQAINDLGAGPPSLPYAGTEGYSGSDTSRQRALLEATEGIASKRQRYVMILAAQAGAKGVTVADLRDTQMHHGRVSGTLSVLHKEGRLVRLAETRDRCKVYVTPDNVNERATEPHGRRQRKPSKDVQLAARRIEQFLHRYDDFNALIDPPNDVNEDSFNRALRTLVDYANGEIE